MLENGNQEQGSLERMGIPLETAVDPNVLSVSASKAIRFRISKPKGYSLQEVDDYVQNIVTPSLEWYANMLHQRDRAVHHLGSELDKSLTDVKNLKSQIQFLEYNSQVKDAIELNADDKEVAALMEQLQQARSEVETLKSQGSAASSTGSSAEVQALEEYIEQITNQYNTLLAEYNKVKEEFDKAISENSSNPTDSSALETQLTTLTSKYDELLETYQTDLALASQKNDQLKAENEQLKLNPADSSADANINELQTHNAQLEEYSQQVTAQYEELYKRYEEDTQALQAQIAEAQTSGGTSTPPSDNELATHNAQLEEYSQQVTAQYEELYKRYEEDTQALQAQIAEAQTSGGTSSPDPELLKTIKQLEDEKSQLLEYIKQLEDDNSEDVEAQPSKLTLPSEDKNKPVAADKYKNLPPGIRPEDLE